MRHNEDIKAGTRIRHIKKHGNSKAPFTEGKEYPIEKIHHSYYKGKVPREFSVIDDEGKRRRYPLRTEMFEVVYEGNLYNEEQLRILDRYTKQAERLVLMYDRTQKLEEYTEKSRELKHRYLNLLLEKDDN